MNGKLYSHNLVTVANHDGADANIAQTENIILGLWASSLTGFHEAGLDYSLWQIILFEKTGKHLSGVPEQRLVLEIVNAITGESQDSSLNKYELISIAADFDTPSGNSFNLIGAAIAFTLIGSAVPFQLIT
jgi:hypothetical protein